MPNVAHRGGRAGAVQRPFRIDRRQSRRPAQQLHVGLLTRLDLRDEEAFGVARRCELEPSFPCAVARLAADDAAVKCAAAVLDGAAKCVQDVTH